MVLPSNLIHFAHRKCNVLAHKSPPVDSNLNLLTTSLITRFLQSKGIRMARTYIIFYICDSNQISSLFLNKETLIFCNL